MNPISPEQLEGSWAYSFELREVPFFKRPTAKLAKAINESISVTLGAGGKATFTMRGSQTTGTWSFDNGKFVLDTGHGGPVTGRPQPDGRTILMESANGEFGDELRKSVILLRRI